MAKKIVSVHITCDEFDVPSLLRKAADWAEKNKELIDEDEMGEAIFDYE